MRDILHCDLNNFYASVECLTSDKLKNLPVAVCGSEKERHGIVLAKNEIAKSFGIKTGMSNMEALKLCNKLVIIKPNFEKYIYYSNIVRNIYLEYTDLVECFGIDECWLDITHSKIFGSPYEIAEKIRNEVFKKTGLTISVGVSFNKIFAKIGSDYKKPNAVTVIDDKNYKQIVWPLKIESMLGVGKHTQEKLNKIGVFTIGQLAKLDKTFLIKKFKKWGEYLFDYANGLDDSLVTNYFKQKNVKSVGNSKTYYKDLTTNQEVYSCLTSLCNSVCERLKNHNLSSPKTLHLSVKNNKLETISKQITFNLITLNSIKLTKIAFELFKKIYNWNLPIRKLGISVSNFSSNNVQLSFFDNININKKCNIDTVLNNIKNKYGKDKIINGNYLFDKNLAKPITHDILDIKFLQ